MEHKKFNIESLFSKCFTGKDLKLCRNLYANSNSTELQLLIDNKINTILEEGITDPITSDVLVNLDILRDIMDFEDEEEDLSDDKF